MTGDSRRFAIVPAMLGLGIGLASGPTAASTTDWFRYTPADGWERRILPEAIIQPPTLVSFQPIDPELQGRVFLDIRDVTEYRLREERIATLYLWTREGDGRFRQHSARRKGEPEPDFECERVTPTLAGPGEVEAIYVRYEDGGSQRERLIHFIHTRDGSRFRVDYTGTPPHFDQQRRNVMASLRHLSFQPPRRNEPRPTLREKIDSLSEALDNDGTRLWLYDGTVAGKRLSDEDLQALRDPIFANVEDLNLISGPTSTTEGVKVGDEGLRHITHLPLTFLCLRGSMVTDGGLAHLADLPLNALVLASTLVEGGGLHHLRSTPLTILDLNRTGVGDDDLRDLVGLPIMSLELSYTRVTDAGMRWLAELPLRVLHLAGTEVTVRGLELLGPELEWVLVPRHIPEERLDGYRTRHPEVSATR